MLSDVIWKTDLDFLIPHSPPIVSLNFTTTAVIPSTSQMFTAAPSNQPKSLPLMVSVGKDILIGGKFILNLCSFFQRGGKVRIRMLQIVIQNLCSWFNII